MNKKIFEQSYGRVVMFALEAHREQKYGDEPYYMHLLDVSRVLYRFGFDPSTELGQRLIMGAMLHDTVEDTYVTEGQIKREFGDEIAQLVMCVTNEPGKNRKERNAKTYPKIKSNPEAILLKLADRIANVEACLKDMNESLYKMYQKEMTGFTKVLYDKDQMFAQEMWLHFEDIMSKNSHFNKPEFYDY